MSEKSTGAEIFVRSLAAEGVKHVFGYPGATLLPIYDMMERHAIRHIMTRHEAGSVHAAEGYARAAGRVGVCLTTSGPGATNLVTGITDAFMDSVPLVAFTGQVPSAMIGNDAFQEADIVGITRTVTKHNYMVKDVTELARTMKEAFHIAATGRPGPVLVDLPKDILGAKAEFVYSDKVELRSYKPTLVGHARQIRRVAEAIKEAERPVLYAGGGVIISGAADELRKLAEKTRIPVTLTLMGLGGFPGDHPLFLGMLGMHGTAYANYAVTECDLLIAVGARFDDRVTGRLDTFAPHAKVVHIDIDPVSISKNVQVDIPVVGDARNILRELNKIAPRRRAAGWLKRIQSWKEARPLDSEEGEGEIKPQQAIRFWNKQYLNTDLAVNPDFVLLAEACGAKGVVIKSPGRLKKDLKEALAIPGPVVIDCQVSKEENVFPMVPAGGGMGDMIFSGDPIGKSGGSKRRKKAAAG